MPEPTPQQPLPPSRAQLTQRCQGFLLTIAELGTELTREVQQRTIAQAGEAGADVAAVLETGTKSFERAALAVRRTVLLIDKLSGQAKDAPVEPYAARKRILRQVEDVIQREAKGERAEALEAELHERIEAPELVEELGTRPIEQVVIEIIRDLGLTGAVGTYGWKRRTPEDVATLNARAAAPSLATPAQHSGPAPHHRPPACAQQAATIPDG